ncbi:uncharacterized protein si:ch211-199g17.2 [Pygocentrus nattereri]|uniref:uncharacterized protein si:ch211-199g17.2 n=1 Tax=Pygocentrus nattereri TaxID=42514 RepID=UPI000814620A|nr:uncharacterized protein si:ch211-199g17.2 [Pygocentrus nattereri]XP_017551639.1 uncharacterized protein si:ch211-199g17.2 [Pygocentrus nattereri]XP_017551648.1 uncharacterized protein si:ch211-199g17.2 [Pygocentrus nattereri]XP_017551657.1 uncharacterized protein si:ch211-199g17.2 [Pygocentrus nattereri]
MQSDGTHTGIHSHLFNSMRKYLCSHDRVQPIVGLGSIIELCTDAEPPVYLCDVCILKINKRDIKTLIMGSLHRYNYIKSRHVYGLKAGEDLTSLAWRLMELAKVVEKKEGTGIVQVLHLDDVIYKEMISKPALDAIAQVKKIKIQTRISGLQSSIFNKRTKCESSTAALSPTWHFTPKDTCGFEHFSRYSVKLSQCELKDVNSKTCTVQSPKLSEESPESYRGTQPLIGLQAVIKCQTVDGDPPPCCYLCQPCTLKVLKSDIIHHLISPQHQLNHINFHHPHLLLDMNEDQSLQTIAMQLELEEGRGQMKVTRLSACVLSEILEKDFDWCMKMLNCASTAEIKPEQGPLMAGSSMSSGCNITLKRPYESTEITVDHSWDGTLHDHIGKVPRRQWSSSRGGVSLKKARHKEPVFKVSLSLSAGPVIVDRMSLVSTTVAPEIECQIPETEYRENYSFSEDITSGKHMLTLEHKNLEQNPETFRNMQLYPTKRLYTEENSQSLRYTNAETDTSTCGYMNTCQFPDSVEHTETVFTGSSNSRQGPESYHRHLHHNLFFKDFSGSSTSNNCPVDGLSSTCNGNSWIMEREEVRNNACDWLIGRDQVTQHANNWPKENHMFVQSDVTQVMLANQIPKQMFGERNYEVMNVPIHMYPAITGACVPAINTYTSYPVQYVNQMWMWGSTDLSNQYNL